MKILYGVCGEGFGHSSRAKKIISHLLQKKYDVLVLTYGQAYTILKKDFPIIKVNGVRLLFDKGALSIKKTLGYNLIELSKNIGKIGEIKKKIEKFKPDVCISDMELFVPIISNFYHLPLISIDNQHRLTHLELTVPMNYKKDYLIARAAVDRCVSRAEAFIILSFTKEKKVGKNTFIVSPILREEVLKLKPERRNFILVYLTKPDKRILGILKKINEKFVVYGYNKEKKEKNLIFKKNGREFVKDLANAQAVIASSGFTLISEAIYLKKPYFAIPLKGQFEQTLNALFIKQEKIGDFAEEPSVKEINNFILHLKEYERDLKKIKSKPNEAICVLDNVLEKLEKNRKSAQDIGIRYQ